MKLIGIVFSSIGLLFFLIGGVFLYNEYAFFQTAVKVQGSVVDIVSRSGSKGGTQYYPVIEFRSETGQRYTFESGGVSSESEYKTGNPVTVHYDPKYPNDAKLEGWGDLIIIGAVFGGIGIVFGSIGGIMLILHIRRMRDIAWLKQNGTRVEAEFDQVFHDTSYKVNGKSPYIIKCNYLNPYDGQNVKIKSDHIWFNPSPYITTKTLSVLIDINNVKRNYVDTSFLPEKG
jgi:hypothetical protein